jgi:hypothetical protein
MEKLLLELDDIKKECSESDWDGYGALPISKKAINYVGQFILLLPNLTLPELSPMPNGRMGLEWTNKDNDLLLSINKKGRLYYTYLSKDEEEMKSYSFVKNGISDELLKLIEKFK